MSQSYSSILISFFDLLRTGRENHEIFENDASHLEEGMKWKRRFRKVNKDRVKAARVAMGVEHGGYEYWEELGENREGVWDVALSELGVWVMRDLPGSGEPAQGISMSNVEGQDVKSSDREGDTDVEEDESRHPTNGSVIQDHIEMMAFIIQTKVLSLIRKITRPDSASDNWPSRYRYIVLTITDMVRLSVLLTRSPIPLRKLLVEEVRSISAELVVLFNELGDVVSEWVRVDEKLGWELECVLKGLNEIESGYLWDGVMSAWRRK